MRIFIIIAVFTVSLHGFSQNTKTPSKTRFEYFFFPGLIYNNLTLGMSYRDNSVHEFSFISSTNTHLFNRFWGNNLNLNFNTYLNGGKSKFYIPVWQMARYTRTEIGYEDGYFPHTLSFGLGSGIGVNYPVNQKSNVRIEAGLGGSITYTNGKGSTKLGDFGKEQHYPDHYPFFFFLPKLKININI